MKYFWTLCGLALVIGCGADENQTNKNDTAGNQKAPINAYATENALTVEPVLEIAGVQDVFDLLDVTRLAFDAEIYVLPLDSGQYFGGDSVGVAFELDEAGSSRVVAERALRLADIGAYRVLLRLKRRADGISLDLGGLVSGELLESIEMEPAPTAARDKEEPAPTAAREDCVEDGSGEQDGAGSDDEASEPAPTAADGGSEDDGMEFEPAPTAARGDSDGPMQEPAPTAARDKRATIESLNTAEDGEASLFCGNRRDFEFYAGIVELNRDDQMLLIRWNIQNWLRSVLAEPFGLEDSAEYMEFAPMETMEFQDDMATFELSSR